MEKFDVGKAMAQISSGFQVKIRCLTPEEIEAHTRPKKRQAKKRYHFLSFDVSDDENFFEMAAQKTDAWESSHRKRRRRKTKDDVSENTDSAPVSAVTSVVASTTSICVPSVTTISTTTNMAPAIKTETNAPVPSCSGLKPKITTQVSLLKMPTDDVVTYSRPTSVVLMQSKNQIKMEESTIAPTPIAPSPLPVNDKIGKIRVKTAAELGSTVIFLDDPLPNNPIVPRTSNGGNPVPRTVNSGNSTLRPGNSGSSAPRTVSSNNSTPQASTSSKNGLLNIHAVADLYSKFFTPKNQVKIRNVAEILQNIAESIKNNQEKVQDINNNNKLTDAQKLMLRYSSFQEFKRTKEANERKLREKFQLVMNVFDETNFETLFRLFFLGMLKILIVSVSNVYKKGTLFKKLLTLLSQSLANSGYKNDRVYEMLKSKDFRDKCITLVQFIEKYSKTELFGMLFLSEADKKLIKSKGESAKEDKNVRSSQSGSEKQDGSFLLNLLKDSKSSESVSTASQPANGLRKTYGPAVKSVTNLPATVSSIPKSTVTLNSTTTGFPNVTIRPNITTNGYANANGVIKVNSVVNGCTGAVNNFVYTGGKVHLVSSGNEHQSNRGADANSNYSSKTYQNNRNNENIQPGYTNAVKTNLETLKKLTTDPSFQNNQNGLRFLLSNNVEVSNNGNFQSNAGNHSNFSKYLEQHGRSALGLDVVPKLPNGNGFTMANENSWTG